MATQTDFWGEIGPAQVRTPAAILREQATLLGQKTKNLVEAQVKTSVSGSTLRHSFQLVVPALDNYVYGLFWLWHEFDMYPVKTSDSRVLQNEEEFTSWLREKLSSPETKRIIGNLLAQANS